MKVDFSNFYTLGIYLKPYFADTLYTYEAIFGTPKKLRFLIFLAILVYPENLGAKLLLGQSVLLFT